MGTLKDLADFQPLNTPNDFQVLRFEAKKEIWTYECPMCQNVLRCDASMEPCCTGPSWSDDHPLVVMRLVGKQEDRRVL